MAGAGRQGRRSAPNAQDTSVWLAAAADIGGLVDQLDRLAADGGDGAGPDARGRGVPAGGPARLAIVAPDERKVRLARRLLAKGEPWRGRSDVWFTPAGLAGPSGPAGKVAFLFPGVEPTFAAGDLDLPALGRRLGLEAPPMVGDTVAHQSASIVRLGIFLDRVLHRLGVEPDLVAGHSVGEWSGTVAAGLLPPEHADALIGGLELDAVELPDVDFAALAAGVDAVWDVVGDLDGLALSHDNSPGQSIVCGPADAVATALARLREVNVLGYVLPFRSGFHTPAIAPLIAGVRDLAGGLPFGPGRVPMWSATTVAPYPGERDAIVDLHLRHLVEPVRFRPLVERLYHDASARIFVQVGTGSLTGFVNDTLGGLDHAAVTVLSAKRSAVAQVVRAVTALWVEGLDVDPHALAVEGGGNPSPLELPPPARPAPGLRSSGRRSRPSGAPAAPAPVAPAPAPAPAPAAPAVAAPQALLGAAEMLAAAAQASHDVGTALLARLAPDAAAAPIAAAVPQPAPQFEPQPEPEPEPVPASRWPTEKVTVTRRLSLESMPETLDHTLYLQPEGWPDVSDLFPIVAMTTQIQLLEDVVAELADGRAVVEVSNIRNFRWLDLSDPVDVPITLVPKGDDTLSVSLGGYCRATIRVGACGAPPRHEPEPLTTPRPTKHSAQELWDLRLMFHGPRFRGIDTLGPIGDDGVLGEFTHLDTPGSLLDNLGKLIAYWVIDQGGVGEGALPIGVESIELFGPAPRPGDPVHCDVRIRELQRDLVRADGVLVRADGTVLCRVRNWSSLVFHLDGRMEPLYHRPSTNYAVDPQPGGWAVQCERWFTGAGRDLTARRFMGRAERARYEAMNVVEQRRHLLETIAVKDAVRHWLRHRFGVAAYPVQVVPVPDGERRFRVECPLVPAGHDPRVTLSFLPLVPDAVAVAVAVVGDGAYRDIEARQVPDGAARERVAEEAAAELAARQPGARVACVAEPQDVMPIGLVDVPEPPPFAVAWTEP